MAGLVGLTSAEYNWAWSIVDAVGPIVDRDVRWRPHVVVHEMGFSPGPSAAVNALRSMDGPVILPQRLADAVREADARRRAGEQVQNRWAELVEATGHATSQVVGLSSPVYDAIHRIGDEEAALDAGLADVWTQERLPDVWRDCESARLIPAEQVPDFSFAGRDPMAASAARDLIAELARQQGQESADFAAVSDELIAVKPDQRWDAVVGMLPGADALSENDRWRVAEKLRRDFGEAVRVGNPEGGTPASPAAAAVHAVTAGSHPNQLDPRLASIAHDPALSPARGAVHAAARGQGDSATGPTAMSNKSVAASNQPGRTGPQTPGLGG
jgi:hypothetical protein